MAGEGRKVRVLLAKPGLDGHDVGVKVLARALTAAGFDVTYTGLRKSPEEIASRARDLGADVIGLSILSGSHISFCEKFKTYRKEYALEDALWLVGGVIPDADHAALESLGVDAVFAAGTPLETIADFIREKTS